MTCPYKNFASVADYKKAYYKRTRGLLVKRPWGRFTPEEYKKFLVEKQKRWRKNNPEKSKMISRSYKLNRRAREKTAKGQSSSIEILSRVEFYGWRCFYCQKKLTSNTLTIDHRIPLAKNGTNWPANLVPACRSCNCRKHSSLKFSS